MLTTKISSNGIYASKLPEIRGHVFNLEFNNWRGILIMSYQPKLFFFFISENTEAHKDE